jgi:SAM-dependent methyltransferase
MGSLTRFDPAAVREAADLIIAKFPHTWAYFCQFRFALAVGQRALMADIPLTAPSLEIGVNDGSSATIAHFGKPKFTWGGDMPEASTFESKGLYVEPQFDKYENVIGMDAHEIPFPDGSFNTVVTNDVLSYGLDRLTILREMTRVLAPGGTLFLSESSNNMAKYPHLMTELRTVVPTIDVLDDSVGTYTDWMRSLGMEDIKGDTWINHQLCALLYGFLRRGETNTPITDANRAYYDETLRALAGLLATDSGEGWQVYMTCKKPGTLQERPTPVPMCLSCRAPLTVTLNDCACGSCKTEYRSEFGNPYVLSDFGRVYSPKTIQHRPRSQELGRHLEAMKLPASVSLAAFDRSTRYVIRTLERRGVATTAIHSDDPLHVGHTILGVPVKAGEPEGFVLRLPPGLV